MNAPLLPTEPMTFEEHREACFDEIERLMWAIRCHAECGERYAALRSPVMLDMVRRDMRACSMRVEILLREATNADRQQV